MYNFIPNTYNSILIEKRFGTMNNFLNYQEVYKNKFEEFLNNFIDFDEVVKFLNNSNINIPKVEDGDYNFYHHNSGLHNDFIFIRNNYHVERLSDEDLMIISSGGNLDQEYFLRTYKEVMFEEGDNVFYGIPNDDTLASSDSITFEFAYRQLDVESIKQLVEIEKIINNCFKIIEKNVEKKMDVKTSYLIYGALNDIYRQENVQK